MIDVSAGHGFADNQPITYHAPAGRTFSSALVNIQVDGSGHIVFDTDPTTGDRTGPHAQVNNRIYLGTDADKNNVIEGHGFSTGQRVYYDRVGTGPVIGGLADAAYYYVIADNAYQVRLAANACQARGLSAGANGICESGETGIGGDDGDGAVVGRPARSWRSR